MFAILCAAFALLVFFVSQRTQRRRKVSQSNFEMTFSFYFAAEIISAITIIMKRMKITKPVIFSQL